MSQPTAKKTTDVLSAPVSNAVKFDDAAFEVFFKEYFHPLYVYCQHRFEFDRDVAKEAVHTGFIRFWESRHVISPDLSPKAYLYKIVTNVCYDLLRVRKVKEKYERFVTQNSAAAETGPEYDKPDFKQLNYDIEKAVSGLPDQMRKIFELSKYEGLKYSQISSQLNISIKTVETQMSRALVKLRNKLAKYHFVYLIISLLFL